MARPDTSQDTARTVRPAAATITVTSLVMLNVAAVVSLRGLPAEAEYGLSSAFYYLLAAGCFLAPATRTRAPPRRSRWSSSRAASGSPRS